MSCFRNEDIFALEEALKTLGINFKKSALYLRGRDIIMASHPIYQFYAALADYDSKIWRRFQVMNNVGMAKLGYILMTLFEMQASHPLYRRKT